MSLVMRYGFLIQRRGRRHAASYNGEDIVIPHRTTAWTSSCRIVQRRGLPSNNGELRRPRNRNVCLIVPMSSQSQCAAFAIFMSSLKSAELPLGLLWRLRRQWRSLINLVSGQAPLAMRLRLLSRLLPTCSGLVFGNASSTCSSVFSCTAILSPESTQRSGKSRMGRRSTGWPGAETSSCRIVQRRGHRHTASYNGVDVVMPHRTKVVGTGPARDTSRVLAEAVSSACVITYHLPFKQFVYAAVVICNISHLPRRVTSLICLAVSSSATICICKWYRCNWAGIPAVRSSSEPATHP